MDERPKAERGAWRTVRAGDGARRVSRRSFVKLSGAAAMGLAFGENGRALGEHASTVNVIPPSTLDASYEYVAAKLVEITKPAPIIPPDGNPPHTWSRRPYLDLNFEDAAFLPVRSAQPLFMKKWDMVHMVTPTHYITFLVSWIGYVSFCNAHVYTRESRAFVEDIHIRPPYPETEMMRNSSAGRTAYVCKKAKMIFEVDGEYRRLRVDWPGFARTGLSAEIDLHQPASLESICAAHIVSRGRAYYSHKINCMPASGTLRVGRTVVRLDPRSSFGMLDFGRGHYPDKTFWYWSTASGRDRDGKLIGWNLGHGNDPNGESENAVFHEGRLHKIGPLKCEVPRGDLTGPWRVRSRDGRVDLVLAPEKVRHVRTEIGRLHSIGYPVYGRYSGRIRLDSDKVVEVRDLFGLYEWFDQRW